MSSRSRRRARSPRELTRTLGKSSSDWSGQSNYHALQANLVQRPIKGLSYQIAYTWSKSIDNGSNSMGGVSLDAGNTAPTPWAFDPRINRGVSDFDVPHNFVANFQYDLPVPPL